MYLYKGFRNESFDNSFYTLPKKISIIMQFTITRLKMYNNVTTDLSFPDLLVPKI